ncbi:zinc finger, CCHC-type containing protein, partial [Tanacetum coccineum]
MDESLWYLDNGASNHMTGVRTHFKEIDEKISGRVRFGDGSYVEIKENGCKIVMQNNLLLLYGQINLKVGMPKCLLANLENHAWLWHARSKDDSFETQFTDLEETTLDEIIGRLKTFEERVNLFTSREFTPYAKVTKPHLKKLDDRSKELIYLGTEPGSKAYRLFDPVTKDMIVSRDVKFKEDEGWDWKGYLDNIDPNKPEWRDFIISENQTPRIINKVSTQDPERNNEDSESSPKQNNTHGDMSDDEIVQPIDNLSTPPPYTYEPNSEESTGYTSSIASSSRPFDHTPVQRYKNLSEIYDRAPEVQSDELLLLEEPRNYKEAAQDKKWIEAMQIEIDSINKNKTWKLATLPD